MPENAFKGLENLEILWLGGGNLPNLHLDLTDNKQLTSLDLSNFKMSTFSIEMLREQRNLKHLYLDNNNLTDLNIEGLLRRSSNVKRISLAGNKLSCSRQKEIRSLLNERHIYIKRGELNC